MSKSARRVGCLAVVGLFTGACGSHAVGGGVDASAGSGGSAGTSASGTGGSVGGRGGSAGGTGGSIGGGGGSGGGVAGSGGSGGGIAGSGGTGGSAGTSAGGAGGSGGSGGGAGGSSCGSQLPGDPASAELALGQIEADLVAAGRRDANFAAVFGADTDSVLAAADTLRAQAVDTVAANEGLTLPAGPPTPLPDPASCGITLAAPITLPEAWKSTTFLATGNLLLALDGNNIDAPYAPLDEKTTSGNVTSHIQQTMHVTLSLTASHAVSVATITTTITRADATSGAALGSTTENATATIDVDFCPTDAGEAIGMITYSGNGTTSPVGSPSGTYQIRGSGSYTIHVNESAETSSVDLSGALTKSAVGSTTTNLAATFTGAYNPANLGSLNGTYVFQSMDAPAADIDQFNRALYGVPLLASSVAEGGAKKKWQGGACVGVRVDPGSEMVDPGAHITVTGTPFQRFLNKDITAPVVATFTGHESLSPLNQPVAAPAPFNFVAGSNFKEQGVVSLKSTSRRGIGTGDATYTVRCDKTCPADFTLNTDTCQCECQKTCGANQVLDPSTCQCACQQKTCGANQRFDPASCQCVCTACPPMQIQDPQTCACSCQIAQMMGGNVNPTCTWSGSVQITSNASGDMDMMMEGADVRTTWSLGYAADLAVDGSNPAADFLVGPVNSTWHYSQVTTGSACTFTTTTDDSLSTRVDQTQALPTLMDVTYAGPGRLTLSANRLPPLTGTTTYAESANCGDTLVVPDKLFLSGFTTTGDWSGNTFKGTSTDVINELLQPDGTYATFRMTWDLTLVPR